MLEKSKELDEELERKAQELLHAKYEPAELNQFAAFTNDGLGDCFVLKKDKIGNRCLYLIYIKISGEHFNIVNSFTTRNHGESYSWDTGSYCSTIEDALELYNKRLEAMKEDN